MKMATEYGKRLKVARTEAKLTQMGLSAKTGIPQSTISTAEREGNGSGETATYADACGVNALWLATGEGPKHPVTATANITGPSAAIRADGTVSNQAVAPVQQAQPATENVAKQSEFYWLLSRIADPLERAKAEHRAIGVVLEILNGTDQSNREPDHDANPETPGVVSRALPKVR